MTSSVKRLKLKKYAILLSYCGAGYYGLQKNGDLPTIESEIFDAFLKSEVITKAQYESPWTIYFQKASRTDKGVSAIKQVLSCHLPIDFCDKISKINEYLPEKIRIVGAKKTTRFFDSKSYCDGRTYNYIMPTYSLCSPEELTCESFRIKPEAIEKFNNILALYKGTHNYHNFTSGKSPVEASAMRYIMEMDCGQPFEIDGLQLVVVRVKGQSFMLHQIRKMIGLAIGIMRGFANEDVIKRSFGFEKIDIPKAPGLGLMLEEVHYDSYNKRYSADGIHEPLYWSEFSEFLNDFKHKHIYPVIIETEKSQHPMISWLHTLPMHTFDLRTNLFPKQEMTKEEEVVFNLLTENPGYESDYKKADSKRRRVEEQGENDEEINGSKTDAETLNDEVDVDEDVIVNKDAAN